MAFFEDLGNKITGAAKAASNKANEMVEVTKLNSRITEATKAINEKYSEIGKLVYAKYKADNLSCDECTEACVAIETLEKEIEELKAQINDAKGCKVCPNCQSVVNTDSKFCPQCGSSMQE